MPAPAWEKLGQFVNPRDFGVACTISFQAGGTRTVYALYDETYFDTQLGEYVIDATKPRLSGKAADFVGVRREDIVNVTGEGDFDIMEKPQPDGTGWVVVELAPR